jgi:hypothetical protein
MNSLFWFIISVLIIIICIYTLIFRRDFLRHKEIFRILVFFMAFIVAVIFVVRYIINIV